MQDEILVILNLKRIEVCDSEKAEAYNFGFNPQVISEEK